MSFIDEILNHEILKDKPPVLIDIGASGRIHKKWKKVAPYSICLAFDADKREMGYINKEGSGFRKLIVYNCIVTDKEDLEAEFYLTKSPFCSSLLHPDNEALEPWAFSDKFEVDSKVKLNSISLKKALEEQKLNYVDWFKTDSQGADLRLFLNIPEEIRNKILAAEFEPGIMDAYHGEDKLFSVLSLMNNKQFWLSGIVIKGSQRISRFALAEITHNETVKKLISYSQKNNPGWGEMMYLNTLQGIKDKRDFLLSWVFAVSDKQYGFAIEVCTKALNLYGDKIFLQMKKYAADKARNNVLKLKFLPALTGRIFGS